MSLIQYFGSLSNWSNESTALQSSKKYPALYWNSLLYQLMIIFLKLFYGILKEFFLIVKVVMFVNNVQADEIRLTIITFITYDTNNDNI